MWPFNRHKHEWEIKDKHVIPPATFPFPTKVWGYEGMEIMKEAIDAKKEKVVWLIQCKVCTKVKRV